MMSDINSLNNLLGSFVTAMKNTGNDDITLDLDFSELENDIIHSIMLCDDNTVEARLQFIRTYLGNKIKNHVSSGETINFTYIEIIASAYHDWEVKLFTHN
jgi:hypothetical protein